MGHIFIAYGREDSNFAATLARWIGRAGFTVWTAPDEEHTWRAEIDTAIREASAVILIMTPEAQASPYVAYEWAFALGAGVPVIPVLLRPTPLHPRLAALPGLDFTNRARRPWKTLIRALVKATGAPSPAPIARETPPKIKQAVAALYSSDPAVRRVAVGDLQPIEQPEIREAIVKALGVIGDAASMSVLFAALHDEHESVRRAAAEALENIGEPAVPGLVTALHDEDEQVRQLAATALDRLGWREDRR